MESETQISQQAVLPVESVQTPAISITQTSGEQPAFQIKPAGAWARFWASFIDSMIFGMPILLLIFLWATFINHDVTIGTVTQGYITKILVFLGHFAYSVYFTTKKGATIGKDAYGLKVVKYGTAQNLTYPESALREIIKSALTFIPLLGGVLEVINGLIVIFSKEKRGIHDRVAKSQVLHTKPAWKMRKQILFFGGYFLILVIIVIIRPQIFNNRPEVSDSPQSKISQDQSEWVTYTDKAYGWSIAYDDNKYSAPFSITKEEAQRVGGNQSDSYELEVANFVPKSSIAKFCPTGGFGVRVLDNSQRLSLNEWISKYPLSWSFGEFVNPKTLDNTYTFLTTKKVFSGGDTSTSHIHAIGDKIYVLDYTISKKDRETFPSIECENNEITIIDMIGTFKPAAQ